MKKLPFLLLLIAFSAQAQLSWQGSTTPEQTDSAVLLFDKAGTGLDGYSGDIYAHTGVTIDDTTTWENVIGTWGSNTTQPQLTLASGTVYSLDLTPTIQDFYNNPSGSITAINIVLRSADDSQQTADLEISIGAFQVTMINPAPSDNGVLVVDNGGSTQILAQNSGNPADYELFANGASVHTENNVTSYNGYQFTNLTENQYCELHVTQDGTTVVREFVILVNNTVDDALPANMEDGINYSDADDTVATLVLDAPNKDFIYVAGSFNNWEPTSTHAMKKDPTSSKYWVELTGLTAGETNTYQYWVADLSPVSGSPELVKTADPYSTLVLSPFDDPWISSTSYPNLPDYPAGQEYEVTVLQTAQTPYSWQVTDFQKPKKEDLVIYEVLIRDFDADRNFQDLIDKIDYFKDLNVNAIQLMPVMEYEGNESWGYNTAFHMALDKYYGTADKLKEFVDLCHQNGIAVILDVALNHAFGRNPMVRMWMDDPDNDGWGGPSSENPYFNQTPMHSYNVGNDFNHQEPRTQYYVERVVGHWIEEFNIDGFRWDLTKGFTQNCSEGDDTCTNAYQQDRVDILKQYADFSWSLDGTHYVIFEHLGTDAEEQEWADYRLMESVPKGIMMWGIMTHQYNQLTMGYADNSDIERIGHESRGFIAPRLVGYAESHDEERLMYKNLQYGNNDGGSYDITDLNTALERMSALGAVTLTVPGPKMIWHFGELGMENSIFTCTDGTVNEPGGTDGDCKLATKPQPQWTQNWPADAARSQIYDDWARLNALKVNEAVFEGDYTIDANGLTPRIFIWDDALPSTELKNVVILANFNVTDQDIIPDFPYTGTWYDLMDETGNTTINVTNTATPINIPAGGFRVYGNASPSLSTPTVEQTPLALYPNPTNGAFHISTQTNSIQVFDLTGKLVKHFKGHFSKNHHFDVSNLPESVYIVKAKTASGGIKTAKLVKF